jgi:hypothetical protein
MMRKIVAASLAYPEWLAKQTNSVSAYDRLNPADDSDEIEYYGDDHKY